MSNSLQIALKQRGYSITHARQTVFEVLQHQEPQSMREVVAACKQIDRASVYRTISLFERLGIVQRLQMGWKYRLELSDAFHQHHHHMHCVRCGRTIALPEDQELETSLHKMAEAHNFTLQSHQLELSGLCQTCRQLTQ
jgi:Fur family transcriptional regulator, ferric uptake regulator